MFGLSNFFGLLELVHIRMDLFEQEPESEPWGPADRQGTRMFAPLHIQLFLPGAKIKETCM